MFRDFDTLSSKMEESAMIWGSFGVILLIFLDETAYRGRTLFSVSQVASNLQGEIYCNTLKLQELGFTKWAIILSYAATFVLILTFLGVLIFLIWMMKRRTPERTDAETQAVQADLIEEDTKHLLIDELNVPILTLGDSFGTDDSNDSYKPMNSSPVLVSSEQEDDNSETFDVVRSTEEYKDHFEFSHIILTEDSAELAVFQPLVANGNVKKLKQNYISEMIWDLTVSKNLRKRTTAAQMANHQTSRIGIEIFTSYLFIYIQDMDSFPQHQTNSDN